MKDLILVVNYDCPNHYEDYVHRCGRTGRAGNKGFAYTFIEPDQGKFVQDIIQALEMSKAEVPQELQMLWDEYKAELESVSVKNLLFPSHVSAASLLLFAAKTQAFVSSTFILLWCYTLPDSFVFVSSEAGKQRVKIFALLV